AAPEKVLWPRLLRGTCCPIVVRVWAQGKFYQPAEKFGQVCGGRETSSRTVSNLISYSHSPRRGKGEKMKHVLRWCVVLFLAASAVAQTTTTATARKKA